MCSSLQCAGSGCTAAHQKIRARSLEVDSTSSVNRPLKRRMREQDWFNLKQSSLNATVAGESFPHRARRHGCQTLKALTRGTGNQLPGEAVSDAGRKVTLP